MKKILFLDTLATGLNPERCAIYNVGGILCEETLETMTEIRRFDLRLRPWEGARVTDNSLWVGGVRRSDLVQYPPQDTVFAAFFKLLESAVAIDNPRDKIYLSGFNASAFDAPFIRNWFFRNDCSRFRDCFFVQTVDLMTLSAFALMNERENMPDFHLETAARFLGVSPTKGERYSCLDNAETCLKIYMALKERLLTSPPNEWIRTEEILKNE